MQKIPFTKMHGTGNDFIMLSFQDLKKINFSITPHFIQKICDRHFGIGADGVIFIEKGTLCTWKYTMYNPDGSKAEMCGNGIRCYMRYLIDNKLISSQNIDVETDAGILHLSIENNAITVEMGTPKIFPAPLYLDTHLGTNFILTIEDIDFTYTPISMGNPHAVIFLEAGKLENFDIVKYGKPIESNLSLFPNKTNVEFVEIIDQTHISMRVWERGAGETLACGTGACACVVTGILGGKLPKNQYIKVSLKGGVLEIMWSGDINDPVIMRGNTENVAHGEYYVI